MPLVMAATVGQRLKAGRPLSTELATFVSECLE